MTPAPRTADARTLYARQAEDYDRRWARYTEASLARALNVLDLRGDERVLDAPIGTGELARRLLERWPGLKLAGIDLAPEMLARAADKLGPDVPLAAASADALPFGDAAFDVVCCANSFHYFPDPARALAEFRRVLRPSGTLALVDWCDDDLACKLCGWWFRLTGAPVQRIYRRAECRALLEAAGFRIRHSERFRAGWLWGMMAFRAERLPAAAVSVPGV